MRVRPLRVGSHQSLFCRVQHSQPGESIETPSMHRLEELDAIRGLLLVWITLAHLPTGISAYVNQPFGFVSAAEGFVFMSALFTGRIYFRSAQLNGYRAMQQNLLRRTLRLYFYHAFLLSLRVPGRCTNCRQRHAPWLTQSVGFLFQRGGASCNYRWRAARIPPTLARHSAHVRYLSWTHSFGVEPESKSWLEIYSQ